MKSSPTDSVAEVNTQAARVPRGERRESLRDVEGQQAQRKSALRELDAARALVLLGLGDFAEARRQFGGARRGLRDAGVAPLLAERRRQRAQRLLTTSCAASASGVSAASQSGRGVTRRISASAARPLLDRAELRGRASLPRRRVCTSSCRASRNSNSDLAAAETRAEELRGEIRNLVRLVDDHRVGGTQQVAEAVFLEREIRQQQVMIDDDDVGLDGLAARLDHVAAADLRRSARPGSCRASR